MSDFFGGVCGLTSGVIDVIVKRCVGVEVEVLFFHEDANEFADIVEGLDLGEYHLLEAYCDSNILINRGI